MGKMNSYFIRLIPASIKSRVRGSQYYNRRVAKDLAKSSKRLDLCAAQIAHVLHLSGSLSLQDKVCLEVGSGWVLSHAVIFHILGARRVIATDITPLAQPSVLTAAIHKAIPSLVRDILSPFCEHSEIRARLDKLLSMERFDFDVLNRLGIEYIAPVDLARKRLGTPLDFIYSASVLEYVPVSDISPLLENLAGDLQTGGKMVHCIHLEDHRSISNNPFGFYSEPEAVFLKGSPGRPVNRIRSSGWRELFSNVKDLNSRFIYQWSRRDKDLPAVIHPSIHHEGEGDLRVSHIGVLGIKK